MNQETRTGNLRLLAITSLAHFINDGTGYLVPLTVDYISLEKSITPIWIAVMLTAYYLASTILSPFVSHLADNSDRPGVFVSAGLMTLSVGLFGFFFTVERTTGITEAVFGTLSAALVGFGSAFYHPIAGSMLQRAFEGGGKGRALGVNGAFGSLGRTLYPALFFALAAIFTKAGTLAFLGVVGFGAGVVVLEGSKSAVAARGTTKTTSGVGSSGWGASSVLTKGILALTLIGFLRAMATQGVNSWIPIYFTHTRGLGLVANVGVALTAMYAGGIVGQVVFGYFVDRFEKRGVLGLSFVGSFAMMLGFLFVPGFVLAVVLLFAYGFFTFTGFPLFLSLASEYVPRRSSSLANALVWNVGQGLGGVAAPSVTAALAAGSYGLLGRSFLVLALVNLVVSAMLPILPPAKKTTKVNMFG